VKTDRVVVLGYLQRTRGFSLRQAQAYINRVLADPRALANTAVNVRAAKANP
jgi:hypothetical protein